MRAHLTALLLLALLCGCSNAPSRDDPAHDRSGEVVDGGLDRQDSGGDPRGVDLVTDPPREELADDALVDGADDAGESDEGPQPWRSALYPEDWTPGAADGDGRALHDFSYAGYHNGEIEMGAAVSANLFDVVAQFSADPTGVEDSTTAVQAAIDAASADGGVVWFPAGRYRFEDRLWVRSSNVVLRGAGSDETELWFTRHEGMSNQSHITFVGALSYGDDVPLVADGETFAAVIEVDDATGFAVGDDIVVGWIITEEFVEAHAMDGIWAPFNDTWQPFFWRTVTAIDTTVEPHQVTLDVPLRYPALVRDAASVRTVEGMLSEVGAEDFAVANAVGWDEAWAGNQVHALEMSGVKDGWVRRLRSFPSPGAPTEGGGAGAHLQSSGLLVRMAKRVTVADTTLEAAQNRGGGGNGYLFEIRQSSEVLFRDCVGRGGRHNFIQNWGFGATGIVWLRVHTSGGRSYSGQDAAFVSTGFSEFHHSLATANLIDSCVLDDGWSAVNRGRESSGAGHSATQSVFWNSKGSGQIRSAQYGWGYVIGTDSGLDVFTITLFFDQGTEPEDFAEGLGIGHLLDPVSLYEDQLVRRLAGR